MLSIALIGCGQWAQKTHLPTIDNRFDAAVVAISGVYKKKEGIELALKYKVSNYIHNWKNIGFMKNIKAVIVSTPHLMHYRQIKFFLERGKHVHVDKPPTLSVSQLELLVKLANKNNLILSIHTQMKYTPGMLKLRQTLEGCFSDVYQINAFIWQRLFDDFKGSWRSKPVLAGGGIMMDSGYHMIDTIHYLLRNRKIKSPHFLFHNGLCASDSVGLVTYSMGNTIVAVSSIRGVSEYIQSEKIEILGNGGYLKFSIEQNNGRKVSNIVYTKTNGNVETHIFPHKKNYKGDPLDIFIDGILYQDNYALKEIESNISISIEVVRVLELAYQQIKNREISE